MKTLLLTSILSSFSLGIFAQMCNHTIPPHAPSQSGGSYHIYSDTTINDPNGSTYYICGGVHLTMSYSAGCNYYLEDSAMLTIQDHAGDNVFAKGYCTITDNSTEGIVVTKESTSTFNKPNMPQAGVVMTCANMIYSYSLVGGSSPCNQQTTGIMPSAVFQVNMYPNPIQSGNIIYLSKEVSSVFVTDLTGRTIRSERIIKSDRVNIDLPNGIYFFTLKDASGASITKRIIVR